MKRENGRSKSLERKRSRSPEKDRTVVKEEKDRVIVKEEKDRVAVKEEPKQPQAIPPPASKAEVSESP